MSEQDKMLALAKAVYPDIAWEVGGVPFVVYDTRYANGDVFDPLHNSEQSMAVLCWLLDQDSCNSVEHDCVRIWFGDDANDSLTFEHDNTPASLRAAILAAALRVVGET